MVQKSARGLVGDESVVSVRHFTAVDAHAFVHDCVTEGSESAVSCRCKRALNGDCIIEPGEGSGGVFRGGGGGGTL